MSNQHVDALRIAADLAEQGRPFVLATVVRALAPTSTKPGDKAVITEDGEVHGWVGGSCAEPIVKKEAEAALRDGECRLLHISPEAELPPSRDGLSFRPMTCYSGGLLEIHVEPHLARPVLLVFGNSPVAEGLVELGNLMRYRVVVADLTTRPSMGDELQVVHELSALPKLSGPHTFVVVASHGIFDEEALEKALSLDAAYVGFVASTRRRAAVLDRLSARGVSDEQLGRIDSPAGLELGAREPREVALSIFAQIVARRHGATEVKSKAPAVVATKKPKATLPVVTQEVVAHEAVTAAAVARDVVVATPEKKGGCCHDG